jgi:4-amino-4-deoxy-L-arabinose transferase-like glycosyltransferase
MKQLLELLRRNPWFFLCVTLAALALRLFFVFKFPSIYGDSLVYGDIAKNWMNHGIYGLSTSQGVHPTLIRLPGYPAFLALIFSVAGQEHYTAVMIVQALIDTNTCLVIAALALELMNARAAKAAYLLAALCPFTAAYTAAPLTETVAIGTTAHALYYGVRGIKALQSESGNRGLVLWLLAGAWIAAGILFRPDGGIVLAALASGLVMLSVRSKPAKRVLLAGVVLVASSLAPLVPWTIRNWRTFHVIQPLAPRYANDPGDFVPGGFNRWIKTWIVDYVSVHEIYWRGETDTLNAGLLPERAFDSRQEYDRTHALLDDYNDQLTFSPQMDAQFEQLAAERINHNPFRYFVWLPFLRIADMWLRPRTETLPIESRWWEFEGHPGESAFALAWAALNLLCLVLALRGWMQWRLGPCVAILIGFVLLRSAFLGSVESPEPRYVLECFPVVLALAGGAFARPDEFMQKLTTDDGDDTDRND